MKRKIITIDEKKCNGCGNCLVSCPEQALQIVQTTDGPKARVVKEFYCDGLGACLGSCPLDALKIEEKEAPAYDDAATVARIKEVAPEMLETHRKHIQEHACACPGSKASQFSSSTSELRQWPVQLTLVNPLAPYFNQVDLLIAADCVPFAYGNFHQDFLQGKSLVIGCPKLDDSEFYQQKLTELFSQSTIKSITVVNMEVPCCFGLQRLVKEAIKKSGKTIPYAEVVISIKGEKIN